MRVFTRRRSNGSAAARQRGRSKYRTQLEKLEDRTVPASQFGITPFRPIGGLPAGVAAMFQGDVNADGKQDLIQFTTDGRWVVALNVTVAGGPVTYTVARQA